MKTAMNTWFGKETDRKPQWWVVDATNKKLGRLASEVAKVLMGKNKPTFTPHCDMGDYVVVVNAEKIDMSGNKWDQKTYFRRSRYFGSIKETKAHEMRDKNPNFLIEEAVRLMLPRNIMSYTTIKKLKVFKGPTHNLSAQKPQPLNLN